MKKNIFADTKGWAAKAVGSRFRYRLMQSFTVALGVILAIMLYLICREARLPLFGYFAVLVFLIIAVVELPLCYLRALRFYVIDDQVKS
jgi:hypothetical protein